MASTSLVRVLLARWYITGTGVLLSLVLGALTFSFFPLQYSSTGTAVVMGPKMRGGNPMLSFDPSMNTSTLILVQSLSSPYVMEKLGIPPVENALLHPGQDSYVVKNSGSTDLRDDGIDRPFFTVTAQSLTPERSQEIVAQVLDEAKQELNNRQTSMYVPRGRSLALQTVVDPQAAEPVFTTSLKAIGIAVVFGLAGTVVAVCVSERRARRRFPAGSGPIGQSSSSRKRRGADANSQSLEGSLRPADLLDAVQSTEPSFAETPFPVSPETVPVNGRPAGFDRSL
jgi:hypothetical protein